MSKSVNQLIAEDPFELHRTFVSIQASSRETDSEAIYQRTLNVLRSRGGVDFYADSYADFAANPITRCPADVRHADYKAGRVITDRIEAFHHNAAVFIQKVKHRVNNLRQTEEDAFTLENLDNRTFKDFAQYRDYCSKVQAGQIERPPREKKPAPDPEAVKRRKFYQEVIQRQLNAGQSLETAYHAQNIQVPGIFGSFKEYETYHEHPEVL